MIIYLVRLFLRSSMLSFLFKEYIYCDSYPLHRRSIVSQRHTYHHVSPSRSHLRFRMDDADLDHPFESFCIVLEWPLWLKFRRSCLLESALLRTFDCTAENQRTCDRESSTQKGRGFESESYLHNVRRRIGYAIAFSCGWGTRDSECVVVVKYNRKGKQRDVNHIPAR